MKLRITAYVLTLLCLMGSAGCGEWSADMSVNNTEITSVTEEVVTETTTEEITETETESTEEFEVPELSEEIPAEAVTKVTISESKNGSESSPIRIEYRDEHDHALLIFYCNEDGETTINRNCRYEYNDNGEYTYKYELSNYDVDEYYSEYDSKNRWIGEKAYKNGKLDWEAHFEYDEYNNTIIDESTYYENESGEILSVITTDHSDCDYDSQGHMIAVREYNSDGSPDCTYTYTYDDKGNVLTEKCVNEDFDPEKDLYKTVETKNEYDPVSGNKLISDKTRYNDDGSVYDHTVKNRTWDSKDRLICVEDIITNEKTFNDTITYDYEDLK